MTLFAEGALDGVFLQVAGIRLHSGRIGKYIPLQRVEVRRIASLTCSALSGSTRYASLTGLTLVSMFPNIWVEGVLWSS
jgi:hypothetical protein